MDTNRPLMFGIVGDSGAGKTTLARGVIRLLGGAGVTPICLDDYHRYSRTEREARQISPSDPAANDLALMCEHLAMLRAGGLISKPVYDHRNGMLRGPERVAATGLVIAYGMLTLSPPIRPDLFDLTLYVEPDATLRHSWRLARDTSERGYSADEVEERRAERERAATRFIHWQRRLVDVVLRFHTDSERAADLLIRRTPANLVAAPLLQLIADRQPAGVTIGVESGDDGRLADRLSLAAPLPLSTRLLLEEWALARLGLEHPPDLTRLGLLNTREPRQRSELLALVQLLIACLLVARRAS